MPNTRHGKTGLFKIQLTTEVESLSIGEIRALAQAPRTADASPDLTPIPDDEWYPVEALAALWREAQATAAADDRPKQPAAITDDERDRQTVAAIAGSWPHGGVKVAGQSRHADYLMPVLGFLTGHTTAEHAGALVKAAILKAHDPSFLDGRDWDGEIDRLAQSSAAKWAAREKMVGLPTLGQQFPALAQILAVLWPTPTLDVGGLDSPLSGDESPQVSEDLPAIDAAEQDLRIITPRAWDAIRRVNDVAPLLFRHGGVPVRIERLWSLRVRRPARCAWVVTANNPAVSTEIARRSIRIRLDPRRDRPRGARGLAPPGAAGLGRGPPW